MQWVLLAQFQHIFQGDPLMDELAIGAAPLGEPIVAEKTVPKLSPDARHHMALRAELRVWLLRAERAQDWSIPAEMPAHLRDAFQEAVDAGQKEARFIFGEQRRTYEAAEQLTKQERALVQQVSLLEAQQHAEYALGLVVGYMRDATKSARFRLRCAEMVMDRVWGRPKLGVSIDTKELDAAIEGELARLATGTKRELPAPVAPASDDERGA